MEQRKPGFPELLYKTILPKIEMIGLGLTIVSLCMRYFNVGSHNELLMFGVLTLSGAYFLMAYVPVGKGWPAQGALVAVIMTKLINIGSSVALVGLLFKMLGLAGANEMALIGVSTVLGSAAIIGFLILRENQWLAIFKQTLLRALIIAAAGIYAGYPFIH